jgi:uncharacterized Zn-finger protein
MLKVNDVILVESSVVACDGGEKSMGHPKVYLNCDARSQVVCPYCSQIFMRTP